MKKQYEIDFDIASLTLDDLIEIEYLQKIQDAFSKAFDLPAIIDDTTGKPITDRSGFLDFCKIVRSTKKGCLNCELFDK